MEHLKISFRMNQENEYKKVQEFIVELKGCEILNGDLFFNAFPVKSEHALIS